MKRQFQRALFLPANRTVLTDSENIGEVYKIEKRKVKCYPTFLHRWLKMEVSRWREVSVLDTCNEDRLRDSYWLLIKQFKQLGILTILYPEINSDLSNTEIEEYTQRMKEFGLEFEMLSGNDMEDILNAIEKYHINPQNSYCVATSFELLEDLGERYHPRNIFYSYFPKNNYTLGFNMYYWGKKFPKRELRVNVPMSLSIQLSLLLNIRFKHLVYSNHLFPFLDNCILYTASEKSQPIDDFIVKNLEWLKMKAEKKGCKFIYLPELFGIHPDQEFIKIYLSYYHPNYSFDPDMTEHFYNLKINNFELSNLFLSILNIPEIQQPALLRNRKGTGDKNPFEYSVYNFKNGVSFKRQITDYFDNLQAIGDETQGFYRLTKTEHKTADDNFFDEANKLADDVIGKISYFKEQGLNSIVLEIALHLLEGVDKQELTQLGLSVGTIPQLQINNRKVSRLRIEWISKFDFQIILPDYGNMVVEMTLLPKALYYLFLKHPEGILFSNLPKYKQELAAIYSKISNFSDKQEIEQNIDRICDPLDNSINVNCSRIKSAFVKLIDVKLAENYFITGYRGEEKKIAIAPELIEIIGEPNLFH
jgi:hypothetical protein